jgi:predicted dehydrogenase
MSIKTNRRNFLKLSSMAGLGLALPKENEQNSSSEAKILRGPSPLEKLKVGIIGTGERGRSHLELCLLRKDIDVTAICDIAPKALAESQKMIEKAGKKKVAEYGGKGDRDYRNMIEKEKLDAIIVATPWEWHSEQAIACMKKGIYVGIEVCGGFSIDECWELVNAHE